MSDFRAARKATPSAAISSLVVGLFSVSEVSYRHGYQRGSPIIPQGRRRGQAACKFNQDPRPKTQGLRNNSLCAFFLLARKHALGLPVERWDGTR